MALKPWEEIAPEPLAFPIAGRTFTVKPLSYKDGLRVEALFASEKVEITNEELWRLGLGDTFDEMVEAGVPPAAVARAGMAAITDYQRGRAAAELIWESGLNPEALAAAATAAKQQSPGKSQKGSTRSTGTAAAGKTPTRASGSGTRTSRKK